MCVCVWRKDKVIVMSNYVICILKKKNENYHVMWQNLSMWDVALLGTRCWYSEGHSRGVSYSYRGVGDRFMSLSRDIAMASHS